MIGAIAVAVILTVFVIAKAVMGPGDLPAPKIKVKEEIPAHLKGKLSPEMEAQIREQTAKYGEIDPNAGQAPTPHTAPPNGN